MKVAARVYVIRIWYEPSALGEVWRASVSRGEEQHFFAHPEDLTAFLNKQAQKPQGASEDVGE